MGLSSSNRVTGPEKRLLSVVRYVIAGGIDNAKELVLVGAERGKRSHG